MASVFTNTQIHEHTLNMKKEIPNFITLLNLLSGVLASIFAAKGWTSAAILLIITAALFDFLDGFAARLLNAGSQIGQELDSLADVVSFGVAPSIILYNRYYNFLNGQNEYLLIITLIPSLAAAYRLAKFNLDTKQKENFLGLPTPASALFIITLVWFNIYNPISDIILDNFYFIPTISVILSYLMISNIPMFSLKLKSLAWNKNRLRYTFVFIVLTTGVLTLLSKTDFRLWLFTLVMLYIIVNVLFYFISIDINTLRYKINSKPSTIRGKHK